MTNITPAATSKPLIIYVGVALIASTLFSWLFMEMHANNWMHIILVLGTLKAFLIMFFYMEIRFAPLWLKTLSALWLAAVTTIIGFTYVVYPMLHS